MSTKGIKLLICSGNLGNAEPDVNSLGSWVPEDGLCHQVVENQKYPIVTKKDDFQKVEKDDGNNDEASDGDNKYREEEEAAKKREKFDLIILGMQESTFEPAEDKEAMEEIMAALEDANAEVAEFSGENEDAEASDEESDYDSDENDSSDASSDGKESTSSSEAGKDNESDSDRKKKSEGITETLQKATKKVTRQAGKATKKASKRAGKASRKVSRRAGKATKKVSKQAVKGTKMAVKAAQPVVDQASKVADKAEKAAKQAASGVNTLTASRDNTKGTSEFLTDGTTSLHEMLQERLPSYTRLLSFQRGEMRLLVYSLDKNHSVQIKSTRAQNTGMAGLANKGGIVAEVIVDRGTVFSFVTCHLEAHEGLDKYDRRCSTLGEIFKGTKKYAVPSIYPDASLACHYCFVLGDLNFRTRYHGRIKYDEQIDDVNKLVLAKNWQELNHHDELRMAIEKQECLHGFSTLYCNFPPTFKVERGPGYAYKKNRTPSYTDRILWRAGNLLKDRIKPLAYEAIDKFATSDHKPIRGAFEVQLNQGVVLRKKQQIRSSTFAWKPREEDKHDSVELFVNDVQADLFEKRSDGSAPDTYVCLVSSPEDILLKKPTKFKQAFNAMAKFLKISESHAGVDIDSADSAKNGWPRTDVKKKDQNPKWTKQELQCQLKPIRKDGIPINLTGAILHIFVFKYNSRQTDEVIGSYPVNLENVFRQCANGGGEDSRSLRQRSWRRQMGHSMKNVVNGRAGISSGNGVSIPIDGPLLKNGTQTGRLRCTVDAWLVDGALGTHEEED